MPRYPVTIGGKTVEVEADTPEAAARQALAQIKSGKSLQGPATGPGRSQEAPGVLESVLSGVRQYGAVLDPVGEYVTASLAGRKPELETAAAAARTLPGLASANPFISGPLSAIGETAAQDMERTMGTREHFNPFGIAAAGATPLAAAGAVRGVRALGRTATRLSPSRFAAAHDEAIQAIGHILNTVDIPYGVAQSKDNDQVVSDYTQWVAIKDLTRNKLLIADYAHRTSFISIDLDTVFAQSKPTSILVTDLPYPTATDGTSALKN